MNILQQVWLFLFGKPETCGADLRSADLRSADLRSAMHLGGYDNSALLDVLDSMKGVVNEKH